MKTKEMIDALRPFAMALNELCINVDVYGDLRARIAESENSLAKIQASAQDALKQKQEAEAARDAARAQAIEQRNASQKFAEEIKSRAQTIIDNAKKEAEEGQQRVIDSKSEEIKGFDNLITEKKARIVELDDQITKNLARHNEILAGIESLKAKL